jgi:hypothetical protein
MRLAPEECSEDLSLKRCYLPTCARRDVDNYNYEFVSIFGHETPFAGPEENPRSLEELVQVGWAILLQSYLQEEAVSFAVFPRCQKDEHDKHFTENSSLNGDAEVLVLQYQIFEACRLQDIRPNKCWRSTRQALERTQMNTAVNLLSSPLSKSGQKNGEIQHLVNPRDETFINKVSLGCSLFPAAKLEILTFLSLV